MVLVNGGREAIGIQTSPPDAVFLVRLTRTDALDAQLQADSDSMKADVAATKELVERVAARLGLVP